MRYVFFARPKERTFSISSPPGEGEMRFEISMPEGSSLPRTKRDVLGLLPLGAFETSAAWDLHQFAVMGHVDRGHLSALSRIVSAIFSEWLTSPSLLVPLPGGSAHGREELRDRPPYHRDEEPMGHQGNAIAGQPRLRQDPLLVAQLLLHGRLEEPFLWGGGNPWDCSDEDRETDTDYFCSSPLRVSTTSESGYTSPPRLSRPHTSSSSGRTRPRVA